MTHTKPNILTKTWRVVERAIRIFVSPERDGDFRYNLFWLVALWSDGSVGVGCSRVSSDDFLTQSAAGVAIAGVLDKPNAGPDCPGK